MKQKIWGELLPGDIQKVNEFLKNEKKKLKKPPSESKKVPESKLIITQEQHNMIGNVQVCRNELISKEICASQNFENQVAVMLRLNRQNHLAIFDFLKSLQQEPFEKFFEVLIEVVQATDDSTQQVRLLIGLFGIYNGQKLNPRADLCVQTLKYLANEDGVTSQQVIGFLKFTFITHGDLHNAELSDLISFDRRHQQCFVGFKQWLQWTFQLPQDLTLVLPNSCYILGLPFAKRLQSESATLTEHIPSDFLALFIQILALTFEKDDKPFLDLTVVAKNGFLDLIEKIKSTQLINLFSGLLHQVRSHDKQWYLNSFNSRRLIEGALILVKESKVTIFDKEVCENLLSDVNNIDQYLAIPSLLKSYINQGNDEQFRAFIQLNAKNRGVQKFLSTFDFAQSLPQRAISNFQALKITPHFVQELAMKIISQSTSSNSFINIAPGLGKTKLILAVAISLAQTTEFPVFILNSSKTLCDRDFQEAVVPLDELKIQSASVISQKAKITFSTTNDFVNQKGSLPGKYHVLLDEYHNIFFVEKLFLEFVEIVKFCESFIGFSGSPLNQIQKKLLRYSFEKPALVIQLTPHTDLGEQETTICKTQNVLVKKLAEIADKYRYDTPQVFILDPQTAKALTKSRKTQRYEYLIDKEPAVVNNMLTDLFNKANDKGEYGTFIINEEMGTGTDFKTSSDIEAKGGLVLVFGIKPTTTSTFEQLSCRVGRIFNKSRRFYIIQDATYTGPNGDYLKYQLKMLRQKECEEARALLSKLKPDLNNSIETSSENDDDKQQQSMFVGADNEDIEMEDDTENQNSHSEMAQSEKSNIDFDNDKSFNPEQLSNKARNIYQRLDKEQLVGVRRREEKRFDKINSKEKKIPQQKEEKIRENRILSKKETFEIHKNYQERANTSQIDSKTVVIYQEECKRCQEGCKCDWQAQHKEKKSSENGIFMQEEDQQIQKNQQGKPKTSQIGSKTVDMECQECKRDQKQCSCDWQKKQSKEDGINLDEISSTENNNMLDVEQFLRKQDQIGPQQTSEVALAYNQQVALTQNPENVNLQFKVENFEEQKAKIDQKKVGEELKMLGLDSNESASKQNTQAKVQTRPKRGGMGANIELKVQKDEVDALYFKNYGEAKVQQEMLDDKVRLEAYKKAIELTCKGMVVLDLGCGTGILSLYALQAGASKVIAIDNADIEDQLNIELQNFGDKFQFIKKVAEDINVNEIGGMVDVIISEWMGYFLLYENMVDSYIYCISKFLKPKGITIPSEASIILRAANINMQNQNIQQENEDQIAVKKVTIKECKKEEVISEHSIIKEFKFNGKISNPLNGKGFESKFNLKISSNALFNAFVGSFEVKLGDLYLSTSPGMELTHWYQSIFFINNPIAVERNDVIEGKILIQTAPNNHRNLVVDITHKLKGKQGSIYEECFTFE